MMDGYIVADVEWLHNESYSQYLFHGHVISKDGVFVDHVEVETVL